MNVSFRCVVAKEGSLFQWEYPEYEPGEVQQGNSETNPRGQENALSVEVRSKDRLSDVTRARGCAPCLSAEFSRSARRSGGQDSGSCERDSRGFHRARSAECQGADRCRDASGSPNGSQSLAPSPMPRSDGSRLMSHLFTLVVKGSFCESFCLSGV